MITAEQYQEGELLENLLKNSPKFRQYYDSRRKKILHPVFWMRDSSLPEGINARATTEFEPRQYIIGIKRIPLEINDDILVAEELEHCVCDEEGYPGLAALSPEFDNLASAINSMLGDLIAHKRLQELGFDFLDSYKEGTTVFFSQLENAKGPNNRIGVFLWMANYASNVLDAIELGIENNEFQIFFDNKYPDIAYKAKKLIERVNRVGYDTPEKMVKLLREILQRYDLGIFFKILQSK